MFGLLIYRFVLAAAGVLGFCYAQQVQVRRAMTLMGSRFEITVVDQDSLSANRHIDRCVDEIERIENLISEWRTGTQVSEVNSNAGIRPVKVAQEVFELTKRGIYFSKQTQGAFDISIAAMDRIWRFDGSMDSMPSSDDVKKSVAKIGYRNIILDSVNFTIFLRHPGMKIGFGSIGKGYAADMGRKLMIASGVSSGMVNASGDIASWGKQLNGQPWSIGVLNPFKNRMIKVLRFNNCAVATSGSYEKYVEFGNKRYSHIIDPKTGYPSTGLVSATVYGPSAEFANGLSTSIMVIGKENARGLMKLFPNYKAILLTDSKKIYYVN